jgi:hypothetical protein
VQVDNLQVTISQTGQVDQISPVETCESGDPVQWVRHPSLAYGNFAQLWTNLQDEDPNPAHENSSPQWAFIDDGVVQPGTGPTHCQLGIGCYGPDSCVVDIYGGLYGLLDEGLRNDVISPPIALPDPAEVDLAGLLLSADGYFHSDLCCGVVMTLKMDVLSTADPAGQTGWSTSSYPVYFYGGEPEYRRVEWTCARDDLVPDARFVKIRITGDDARISWCWCWLFSSPAPYFDNVRLQAIPVDPLAPVPLATRTGPVTVHPNPFNPRTLLTVDNPRQQLVRAEVFDLRGRLVARLVDAELERGRHVLEWQGRDQQGRQVPSGEYFFKVRLGPAVHTGKGLLLR